MICGAYTSQNWASPPPTKSCVCCQSCVPCRDRKDKVDPADFTVEGLKGEEAGRVPGSINGQQFIIQNCQSSQIFLLDHINTITIDDCSDCTIFIGPTTGRWDVCLPSLPRHLTVLPIFLPCITRETLSWCESEWWKCEAVCPCTSELLLS